MSMTDVDVVRDWLDNEPNDKPPFYAIRALVNQAVRQSAAPREPPESARSRVINGLVAYALAAGDDVSPIYAACDYIEQLPYAAPSTIAQGERQNETMSGGVESRHVPAQEDRRQVGKALPVTADALSPTGQPCAHRAGVAPGPLTPSPETPAQRPDAWAAIQALATMHQLAREPAPSADARDAARYRWLRDNELSPWAAVRAKGAKTPADIDAAIDAAMAGGAK